MPDAGADLWATPKVLAEVIALLASDAARPIRRAAIPVTTVS
jgi:hypothetical protein